MNSQAGSPSEGWGQPRSKTVSRRDPTITPPVLDMYAEMGAEAPVAVADAGLYMASDEAAWVTGTNIVVDGGARPIM